MDFAINQIFINSYTPEAAAWCNENRAYIEEIEPQDSVRRFQIVAVPEPTHEEQEAALQKQYTRLIQSILDKEAYALGYTGPDEQVAGACLSVCSYGDTGVQKFDDEARAFKVWRSAVWAKGYEILALVKAGEMAIPTEEELVEMLPKLEIVYTEAAE